MSLIVPAATKQLDNQTNDKAKTVGVSPWSQGHNDGIILKEGSRWDTYYAMYRDHQMVRAAIDKIAKSATNVGFDFVPRDARTRIRSGELKVLKDFFGKQRDFTYELRRIYRDLLIYGDAYLYVVPDKKRRPHSLKRLAPKTIAAKTNAQGHIIGYVQYDPNDMTNQHYVNFEKYEILHFRIDDPDNDIYGLSPLESLKWSVAADIYAQQYNAAFFQNSGVTGTIISVQGVDPDEIERNRKWLMENYTGPNAAHKPIFLEGQNVTVEKSVNTHSEMGFLEGRKFVLTEILAVLDVPPTKVGINESANRSNSKEQDKSFRAESVAPIQYIVESVLNAQFIQPVLGVQNTVFVHSEGDTRDSTELMDYFTKGIGYGVYNPNEIRSKMGMAPVDGGDVNAIMTPTGFVPLDRLDLFFRLPAMNDDKVPLNPENRDPVSGEPPPTRSVHTEVGTGQSITKSNIGIDVQQSLDSVKKGVYTILVAGETPNRADLLKTLTYLDEGKDINPTFNMWYNDIKKALRATDDLVQEAYLSRLREEITEWIQEQEHASL